MLSLGGDAVEVGNKKEGGKKSLACSGMSDGAIGLFMNCRRAERMWGLGGGG
jgi:hypothetical protein